MMIRNCVMIVLNKDFGGINKVHSVTDFQSFGVVGVEDFTHISYNSSEACMENSMISQIDEENFRHILKLTLSEPSKENVLLTIHKLEQMDGIVYAGPYCEMAS